MKKSVFTLVAAVLFSAPPFVAEAFDWTPKSSAEERAAFVFRARAAGENALADRVAALDDAAWIDAAIRGAEELLSRTEDLDSFDAKRRAALELLDFPLHVDNYARTADPKVRTAFEESAIAYARRAVVRVRDEVRNATVAPGTLRAWHVYNMAYVLKGPRHTVLVDFTPYPFAKGCAAWTDEDWDAFAELGDLLVVTHPHRDHLSIPLIRRMQAKGKPVVLPCAITNVTAVVLDRDHAEPVNVAGVAIRNFCGFQGNVPCNSYNLEIDGVTVADNGDNSDINKDARQMDCPPADLIIAATWNRPMFFVKSCMLARGFRRDRAVFLPSHDNELMHSVPHRESYHELYASDRRLGAPDFTWPTTKVLAWGESITVGAAAPERGADGSDVPTVVFTFDDGFREHYTEVAPILERYGFRGTFNVITDRIGTEQETEFGRRAYMTWDQVRDLVRRGHAIESHTLTHPNLKELAEKGHTNEVRRQIFESAKRIESETGVYPALLCHPYCQKDLLVDEYTYAANLVPMGTYRPNFGEGTVANTPTGAGAYIAEQTAKGCRLVDLLTHGVTIEGHAWRPYAKPADFEEHVKEVKSLVDAGKVKVALYRDVVKTSRAWPGFERGIGIGGWLTNYKRFNVLPDKWRMPITVGDLEHFESYIAEKDVAYIAKCGFDHIRLGFDQIVMEEKPYVYREQAFKCIDRFLGWCEKCGLNVVLNMHKAVGNYCDSQKDQAGLMDDPELQKRFIALWTEFERRYAAHPNVAFELLNEVVGVESEKWNSLAQRTLDAIRALNKGRTVVIGPVGGNYGCFLKRLKDFHDEKVVYTFHNYEPGFFTHQRGVLQASNLYYNRTLEYPCADVSRCLDYYKTLGEKIPNEWKGVKAFDRKWLKGSFEDARKWSLANPDKVLWFGEFGTIRHAPAASRVNYMRDSVSIARECGFPYCVWNYCSTPNDGNRFSLVDDDTRKFLSRDLLDACLGR